MGLMAYFMGYPMGPMAYPMGSIAHGVHYPMAIPWDIGHGAMHPIGYAMDCAMDPMGYAMVYFFPWPIGWNPWNSMG